MIFLAPVLSLFSLLPGHSTLQDTPLQRENILKIMKKAGDYYYGQVSYRGGYLYYYSTDLKRAWGEGEFDRRKTIFVQPPATPTVGQAFLAAYQATQDDSLLQPALQAGKALCYGQLQSGGWTQAIHFSTTVKRLGKYRNGRGGSWNLSSLDDNQTQSALLFLMQLDEAMRFKEKEIHEAVLYGLEALLKAQFPNGAFPQVFQKPAEKHPVKPAQYPPGNWKTDNRVKEYWNYYTLNDNLAGDMSEVLITAYRIYQDKKYLDALQKLGDFLILAQMPEPQPGWCQQYHYDMYPIWARKFEPPAVSGSESQDVMRALIRIYHVTNDKKYLEPIPRALTYFTKKCLLPDQRVARFYELKTNKPLYMDKNYQLTYNEDDLPAHYGWKQPATFHQIQQRYEQARAGKKEEPKKRSSQSLAAEARKILASLDEQGRWISEYQGERLVGQPKFPAKYLYLSSEQFSKNMKLLAELYQVLGSD